MLNAQCSKIVTATVAVVAEAVVVTAPLGEIFHGKATYRNGCGNKEVKGGSNGRDNKEKG